MKHYDFVSFKISSKYHMFFPRTISNYNINNTESIEVPDLKMRRYLKQYSNDNTIFSGFLDVRNLNAETQNWKIGRSSLFFLLVAENRSKISVGDDQR